MTHDIVQKIEADIARLEAQRDDLTRQIAQYTKARDALLRVDDPDAPLADVVEARPKNKHRTEHKPSSRPRAERAPEFRPLAPPGPQATAHERTLHKVLAALTDGASTSSEVLASITLPKGGLPPRIQIANAIRDLKARGLVEEAGGTGEPISGRGRAPRRLRVVQARPAANAGRPQSNGVRRAR